MLLGHDTRCQRRAPGQEYPRKDDEVRALASTPPLHEARPAMHVGGSSEPYRSGDMHKQHFESIPINNDQGEDIFLTPNLQCHGMKSREYQQYRVDIDRRCCEDGLVRTNGNGCTETLPNEVLQGMMKRGRAWSHAFLYILGTYTKYNNLLPDFSSSRFHTLSHRRSFIFPSQRSICITAVMSRPTLLCSFLATFALAKAQNSPPAYNAYLGYTSSAYASSSTLR